MNIILTQYFEVDGEGIPFSLEKTFESNVIPNIGMSINDSLWKEPYDYKVAEVTIDYSDDTCYITLEKYAYSISKGKKTEFVNMAKLHSWKSRF